jgi:hypothetical protein
MNRMEPKKPPCFIKIPTHALGWVLVFDLDNTIVGEYFNLRKYPARKIPINPLVLDILRYAISEREKEKGEVSAILLLTNNNDADFIAHVDSLLKDELKRIEKEKEKEIFDLIADANHPLREVIHGGAMHGTHIKSIKDVIRFVKLINKPHEELLSRCIFIDDQIYHQLAVELIAAGRSSQFIHICPPYITPAPMIIPHAPIRKNTIIVSTLQSRLRSTAFAVKPIPHLLGSAVWNEGAKKER